MNGEKMMAPERVESETLASIERIRESCLAYFDANKDEIDERDLTKLRDDQWTVERHLLNHGGKEEQAGLALIEAMKWRKVFGINDRTDDFFPAEFYKVSVVFPYGSDREGNQLLYFRSRMHRKVSEVAELGKQFLAHRVNQIDEKCPRQRWAMIFDLTGAGLANIDMDTTGFLIHILQQYFPYGYKYTYVNEMPWIMMQCWRICKTWMSQRTQESVHIGSSGQQIFDYVDPDQLPTFIPGGQCRRSVRTLPPGVKPGYECPQLGLTKAQIDRLLVVFKSQLDEAAAEEELPKKESQDDSLDVCEEAEECVEANGKVDSK